MAPLSNEVRNFLREYYEATGPSREECPRCRNTAFVHRAWVADLPLPDEEIRAGLAQHAHAPLRLLRGPLLVPELSSECPGRLLRFDEPALHELGARRVARQCSKKAPQLIGLHVSFRLHHARQSKRGKAGPSLP